MTETRTSKGFPENRTASDSKTRARPIPAEETDALPARLKEVIGDESKSSFARRAGLPEANIRSYLEGKSPGHDVLAALAFAGGVTADWLATGRLPKERNGIAQQTATYHVAGEPAAVAAPGIDGALLRQCLAACSIAYGAPFAASTIYMQLEHATAFYNALVATLGARMRLEDLARLEARDLAAQLRLFVQTNLVRPFEP